MPEREGWGGERSSAGPAFAALASTSSSPRSANSRAKRQSWSGRRDIADDAERMQQLLLLFFFLAPPVNSKRNLSCCKGAGALARSRHTTRVNRSLSIDREGARSKLEERVPPPRSSCCSCQEELASRGVSKLRGSAWCCRADEARPIDTKNVRVFAVSHAIWHGLHRAVGSLYYAHACREAQKRGRRNCPANWTRRRAT